MGFFSSICLGCHQSVVSPYGLRPNMGWLNYAVAIQPDGTVASGSYDGYGRIDPDEDDDRLNTLDWDAIDDYDDQLNVVGTAFTEDGREDLANSPAVWHEKCWVISGRPRKYPGEGSPGAADQGYFFDGDDYIVAEPKTLKDLALIRKHAAKVAARNRREMEAAMAEYHKAKQS